MSEQAPLSDIERQQLRSAKRMIEKRGGWSHGWPETDDDPPCLGFACIEAGLRWRRAEEVLRPYFPAYARGSIAEFNDHWRTRKRDVLAVLDSALEVQP